MAYIMASPSVVGKATKIVLSKRQHTSTSSASMTAVSSTGGPWNGWLWDDGSSGAWGWAKWILFVLFVVFALGVVFATSLVNRKRHRMGQAPIRGTAWIMPPSYRQSERDYVGNSQRNVEDYVPEYTEEANENDLGYYDERGEFHPNGKAEYIPPPPLDGMDYNSGITTSDDIPGSELERPERARVRDYPSPDYGQDYIRPTFISDVGSPTFPGYYSNLTSPASAQPTSPQLGTTESDMRGTEATNDAPSPASTDQSIEREEFTVEKNK